jgi:hypothetical protein
LHAADRCPDTCSTTLSVPEGRLWFPSCKFFGAADLMIGGSGTTARSDLLPAGEMAGAPGCALQAPVSLSAGDRSATRRVPACWRALLPDTAQPKAVQPVPDGVPVHAQLAGDLDERPPVPGHAVNQIGLEAGEAELGSPLGQVLVSGADALVGGAEPPGWWGQAGVVEQAAGDHGGGGKLAGQSCEAGLLLAARREVAGKVGEAQGDDAVAQSLLLAVDDREAASEDQAAVVWCCQWYFPCARGAGSPTTPGDPLLSGHQWSRRGRRQGRPSAWARCQDALIHAADRGANSQLRTCDRVSGTHRIATLLAHASPATAAASLPDTLPGTSLRVIVSAMKQHAIRIIAAQDLARIPRLAEALQSLRQLVIFGL